MAGAYIDTTPSLKLNLHAIFALYMAWQDQSSLYFMRVADRMRCGAEIVACRAVETKGNCAAISIVADNLNLMGSFGSEARMHAWH